MFLLQVGIDLPAAVRHVQAVLGRSAARDEDLVLKTVLTDAFSGPVFRPWHRRAIVSPEAQIIAYAQMGPEEARERLSHALPSARAAVGEVLGYSCPPLATGQRLGFSIRLCPTVNSTRRGETDAFLLAADAAGTEAGLTRDAIYAAYLAERVKGATIVSARLTAFRLLSRLRKSSGEKGLDARAFPDATLAGVLTVDDPASLAAAMQAGIGRQRAFGCGMLVLSPPPL